VRLRGASPLLSAGAATPVWGPTVDAEACDGCRTCVDFCHNHVYAFEGGKAVVVERGACVVGCSYCASLCEKGAITFPPLEQFRRKAGESAV
jgi:NAD-dependent dihydropyrimidine dehydrogenase PreA subunit